MSAAAAGLSLEGKDAKTAVNQFCQRYCARPVTKECIVYQTTKFPTGYQSILRLNCIDGQEFAGEMASTSKEAEKSACMQVLNFYADAINNMPNQKKGKKRPAGAGAAAGGSSFLAFGGEPAAKVARTEPASGILATVPDPTACKTPKSELNAMFSKICRRVMGKNEVIYETLQVQGGFQSTVKMPGLPDQWGSHVWAGEVCEKKADSEQSAAGIALAEIQTDPSFQQAMTAPTAKQKNALNWKLKGGMNQNKGKGKGKGGPPGSALPTGGFDLAALYGAQAAQGFSGGFSGGFS